MITQQINISFSSAMADTIRIHTAEVGRVIVFIPDVELEQDQSAEIIIVKPDNTFVIDDATIVNGLITVTIPEQAGAVSGVGGYILKVYKDSLCVYSASGPLMVDDHLLTDGMIESVAEAHGYVFPDDFLTDDDIVINPTTPAFATLTKIKYKGITYEVDGGAEDLNDLSDVTLTNPETGEVLTYDGQKWVNEALYIPDDLNDLDDVDITTPASGDVLQYDGQKWENNALYIPADLDDLDDVTITSPASGNVLQYDGTGWVNAALSIPDELSDLSDVAITSPASGNVLMYNGAAWQNQNLTIPEDLDDLGDVEISAPSDGQQLVYNDGLWENQTITPVISKTATGNPIEFSDGADAPLVKCVTAITGYQSGTGTPSPDNIRPIVAYTEGKIEARGKNICNKADFNTTQTLVYKPIFVGDGTFTMSTNCPPTTVTTVKDIFILGGNVDTGADSATNGVSSTTPRTVTAVDGYITIASRYNSARNNPADYDWMLVKGSEVADYEPYTSTTHTTTYPSAIYRGSEDVVKGEVSYDMSMVDLGDFTWTYNSSSKWFTASMPDAKLPPTNDYVSNLLSSAYMKSSRNYMQNYQSKDGLMALNTSGNLIVRNLAYTDATVFKAAMSGVQLAYELATPTTSPATPTNLPIKSLNGYSHIESSTGDMEVEYITKTYEPIIKAMEQLVPANTRSIQSPIRNTIEETPHEIKKIVPEDEKEVVEEDAILRLTDEEGGEENADQRLTDE